MDVGQMLNTSMFNEKITAVELFRTFFKNANQIPWKLFDYQPEGRGESVSVQRGTRMAAP
jgi:hypothetical protein